MAFAPETAVESVRWDLDDLYASGDDPRIEADLTEAQRFAEDFEARYRGRLGQLAPAEFLAMMTALEAALEMGSRPAIYAQLKYSQDTGDEAAGRLLGRIRDAGARRGRHLVFFSLELAALDEEAVERLAAAPETARYRHLLDRERMHRPHQLSEPEERLLTELDPVGTVSWTRLYSELCAAIRVSLAGSEVTLAEAVTRLRDPDRERRLEAAGAITAALDADLRTRAYAFNVVLLDKQIGDRMRGYPSWIADRNLANETGWWPATTTPSARCSASASFRNGIATPRSRMRSGTSVGPRRGRSCSTPTRRCRRAPPSSSLTSSTAAG